MELGLVVHLARGQVRDDDVAGLGRELCVIERAPESESRRDRHGDGRARRNIPPFLVDTFEGNDLDVGGPHE